MKKLLTFIMLFVSLFTVLAVVNTKQVEAWTVNNGTYIYFERPNNWSGSDVNFMIGNTGYSQGKLMTLVPGTTNIYYVKMPKWENYGNFAFFGVDGEWAGEDKTIANRKPWALSSTEVKNAAVSANKIYTSSLGTKNLNYTITVNASEGGKATVSGKSLSNGTLTDSTSSIAYSTNAKLTATPNAGYKFVGWYDGSTLKSSSETYTVQVTAAKTYTAKFECLHASNGGWVNTDKTNHWKVCSTCGVELNKAAHKHTSTRVEPTLEADGSVTYTCECGHTYTETLSNSELIVSKLKELVESYYNDGVYVRETQINLNEDAKEELSQYFHNPGTASNHWANLQLERKTNFCKGYLHFNEGSYTAFGTNSKGVYSFTWKEGYEYTGLNENADAIDNYFVTLKDFADLVNNSSNAGANGVDLSVGWTYADGVYTSSDANVIAAAKAFTAPGWKDADQNYMKLTHVTITVEDGNLVIALHAHAENVGLLVEAAQADLVFAKATITK